MTANPDAAPFLRRVPGWESARVTPFGRGNNNAVFLLERNGERAVLKIAVTPRAFPLNTRADEARAQRAAHAAGLAPGVLYADEDLLLEEFIDLEAGKAPELRRVPVLQRLAAALRDLHALPPTGRPFPLHAAAHLYRDRLRSDADPDRADRCLAAVAAIVLDRPLCCCHNDLVAGNILAGDGMLFLDWEYAADNDPLFDLATVLEEHGAGEAAEHALLDAYFGDDAARHRDALRRMREAYSALTWLWRASRR